MSSRETSEGPKECRVIKGEARLLDRAVGDMYGALFICLFSYVHYSFVCLCVVFVCVLLSVAIWYVRTRHR